MITEIKQEKLESSLSSRRSCIEKWKEEAGIVASASSMKYKAFVLKIPLNDVIFEEINFHLHKNLI